MRSMLQASMLLSAAVMCIGVTMPRAWAEMTFVRITPEQYQRTIHDVFGRTIKVDADIVETGFRDQGLLAIGARKLTLTSAGLESYEALAQQIAAQVVEPQRVATLIQCKPKKSDGADDSCAAQFIEQAGLYLFSRPLSQSELKMYVETSHDSAETLQDFSAGISAALVQMLISPDFLFRVEQAYPDPDQPGKLRLDAYSTASRLSSFLWDSAPDGELLATAKSGAILSQRVLDEQVDRLLNSPRVEHGLRAFFSDMLGFDEFATLSKDASIFPKFTKDVQDAAREQTLRTVVDQLLDKNKDYRELFVTRETFLTPALAALYGVPLPRSQELGGAVPWVPYTYRDSDTHIGLLTHASFVALHSHPGKTSPTLRGKALRESLLCQKVPAPPGEVDFSNFENADQSQLKTVRERLERHASEPMCAGCHKITDPIGLAFETFDSAAVPRTTENGAPIDVSGEFSGKDFDGIVQLANLIKDDPAATSCLITRAYSYGVARAPSAQERQWLDGLKVELSETGVKWRELMRRIASNKEFYTIPASEPQRADALQ